MKHSADAFFGAFPPVAVLNRINYNVEGVNLSGVFLKAIDNTAPAALIGTQTVAFKQGKTNLGSIKVVTDETDSAVFFARFAEANADMAAIARKNAIALAAMADTVSPKQTKIPDDYKVWCTEMLDFLSEKRRFIETNISPFANDFSQDDVSQIMADLEKTSAEEWQKLQLKGNDHALPFQYDADGLRDMKQLTERVLTHELVGGTNWHRSYFKPMGYPGDFQIMNYMYDHQPLGDTFYSKYLHVLGLISGELIVQRMNYIYDFVCNMRRSTPDSETLHVMSVGAGPSRELIKLLKESPELAHGFSYTLVDQEEQALEYAISNCYKHVSPIDTSMMISGMHTSFVEMLRPNSTFRHMPKQNLIYSAGLLDYLNPSLSRKLVSKLYAFLKPGGSLIIGNVNNDPHGGYWQMEMALDWTLQFRTQEEMYDMCTDCPDGEAKVELDKSGAVHMLTLTKPA